MKFKYKFIPLTIFIAINILVIMAMNFCAYTSYLHPTYHPNWSYFGLAFPAFLLLDICFVFFWLIFKRKFALMPIVGMLLCAGSVRTYFPINFRASVPDGAIKLLSYNVMNFGGAPMRQVDLTDNPIVNYILNSDADIVCIQEGVVVGKEQMIQILGEKYPYIMDGAEDGCHTNVCLSKFPILNAEHVRYESKTNRSYAYNILVGSDTLLVVNNHFESYQLHEDDREAYKDIIKHPEDQENKERYQSLTQKLVRANSVRGLQVDRVAEYMDSVPCRYKIACGDFNDPSISYTHHRMTRNLRDAYTQSGFGPGISFHTSGMYFRIDNILINENIDSYRTEVDNSISESDHYPIFSYLILKEK